MNKTLNDIKTQVRFPQDLWNEMKQLASKHERSSNGEIVFAVREYVAQQKREEKKSAHASESSTCAKVVSGDHSPVVCE